MSRFATVVSFAAQWAEKGADLRNPQIESGPVKRLESTRHRQDSRIAVVTEKNDGFNEASVAFYAGNRRVCERFTPHRAGLAEGKTQLRLRCRTEGQVRDRFPGLGDATRS
jgi:hypothetical protein